MRESNPSDSGKIPPLKRAGADASGDHRSGNGRPREEWTEKEIRQGSVSEDPEALAARRRAALWTWYGMVATIGGTGLSPWAPGTAGSAVALLVSVLLGSFSRLGGLHWALILLGTTLLGTLAADRYARRIGVEDPKEVVVDEVAGYWAALWGLPPSYAIPAFFLFRIVDILKPFPVSLAERLPGGAGIMADDLVGGIFANLFLRAVTWLFLGGGFAALFGG